MEITKNEAKLNIPLQFWFGGSNVGLANHVYDEFNAYISGIRQSFKTLHDMFPHIDDNNGTDSGYEDI